MSALCSWHGEPSLGPWHWSLCLMLPDDAEGTWSGLTQQGLSLTWASQGSSHKYFKQVKKRWRGRSWNSYKTKYLQWLMKTISRSPEINAVEFVPPGPKETRHNRATLTPCSLCRGLRWRLQGSFLWKDGTPQGWWWFQQKLKETRCLEEKRESDLIHSLETSWSRKSFRTEQNWGHWKVSSSTACIFNKTILYFTVLLIQGLHLLPEPLLALSLPVAMPDTSMCVHSLISPHSCETSSSETLNPWPMLITWTVYRILREGRAFCV